MSATDAGLFRLDDSSPQHSTFLLRPLRPTCTGPATTDLIDYPSQPIANLRLSTCRSVAVPRFAKRSDWPIPDETALYDWPRLVETHRGESTLLDWPSHVRVPPQPTDHPMLLMSPQVRPTFHVPTNHYDPAQLDYSNPSATAPVDLAPYPTDQPNRHKSNQRGATYLDRSCLTYATNHTYAVLTVRLLVATQSFTARIDYPTLCLPRLRPPL